MSRLRKFLRAPSSDKGRLGRTWLLLAGVRLGLWLLPFSTLRRILARWMAAPTELPANGSEEEVAKVIWAVKNCSRLVPGASCLTQALAAKVLLTRLGQATSLRIGVAKNAQGRFQAHAWVERDGRILIGGVRNLRRYTALPPLEGDLA